MSGEKEDGLGLSLSLGIMSCPQQNKLKNYITLSSSTPPPPPPLALNLLPFMHHHQSSSGIIHKASNFFFCFYFIAPIFKAFRTEPIVTSKSYRSKFQKKLKFLVVFSHT